MWYQLLVFVSVFAKSKLSYYLTYIYEHVIASGVDPLWELKKNHCSTIKSASLDEQVDLPKMS